MTNHYSIPGGPACRCPYCKPAPLPAEVKRAWRKVQHAMLSKARRLDAKRKADELAEYLAQDVH